MDVGLAAISVTTIPVSISTITSVEGSSQGVLVPFKCVILRTPWRIVKFIFYKNLWVCLPDIVSKVGITIPVSSSSIVS